MTAQRRQADQEGRPEPAPPATSQSVKRQTGIAEHARGDVGRQARTGHEAPEQHRDTARTSA